MPAGPTRPVADREQITIGHRVGVAHQVLLAGQFAVDPLQPPGQALLGGGFDSIGRVRVEQRTEFGVQFHADEGQPGLQLVTRQRAIGGRQVLGGRLVGDVLHDRRAFAQFGAVVEHQQRHVAERVDGVVVGAVGELVGLGRGGDGFERQARFLQGNVGGE